MVQLLLPLLGIGLNFLKKYWLPLAMMALAGGLLWAYGHNRYIAGKRAVEKELAVAKNYLDQCKEEYRSLENLIKIEMERQKRELDAIRTARKETLLQVSKSYRERVAVVAAKNKNLERRIQSEIAANATVCAPDSFRMFYDDAVNSFGREGGQGTDGVSGDTGRATGATETFEASAITQVAVDNILQYNQLAAQCNALIDIIVKERERRKGLPK